MPKARTLTSSGPAAKLTPLSQGRALVKSLLSNQQQKSSSSSYTTFQVDVWAACSCVPRGKVTTYGAIAEYIGRPKSSRAVGQALSQNPFAPTVPCHRVVGANRHLTGFSGEKFHAGGTCSEKKVGLLKAEGVAIDIKSGKVAAGNMIF